MGNPVLRRFLLTTVAVATVTATCIAVLPGTAAADVSSAGVSATRHYGAKSITQPAARARSANTLAVDSSASTGVVSPKPKVYLVFWGSQWSHDPAAAAPALQKFFQGLFGAKDTWGTILDQYCEGVAKGTTNCGSNGIHVTHPTASILGGAWFDNGTAAPTNATAAQIASEATRAATHFGNTTQTPNLNAQYVIASASGTHPDGFPNSGFCAYHNFTNASFGKVAFTNLPYVPDLGAGACTTIGSPTLLDGLFSTETHEYGETVTDFFPSIGWNGTNGEIGDECIQLDSRITLTTGTFDVQGLWSNARNACRTTA
ncbi:MAG TPA: hypothetical protein VH352_15630 [Pseudonocardiaceae bacterium]|jgi:hypothetical protein|nr:hypothetical protein [Pseudonocardiaceae bacterium]